MVYAIAHVISPVIVHVIIYVIIYAIIHVMDPVIIHMKMYTVDRRMSPLPIWTREQNLFFISIILYA